MIVSCSRGRHLGKKIAKMLGGRHSDLLVEKFPDDELRVKFTAKVVKEVILVQSFYSNISDCILETIFAAETARELGARRVILVAPYFPYLRQDMRFHRGEAVSQGIAAGLIEKYFDSVFIIDPHLHRKNSLKEIFRIKSVKLSANRLIADFIKSNIKNPVAIGPDEESYKWARNVAGILGIGSRIMEKKRYSSYHVQVKLNKPVDLRNKSAVIVDDIISTGHTIMEAAKILKKLGAKNVYCICVHGIFVNDALSKLRKAGIKVVSTNTIPNKAARIDVSGLIALALKEN